MDAAPPLTIVGGLRHDPAFNRLSSHIHQAAKQFQSVNPGREYPNLLVFTSSDRGCMFTDLISTLTGNFYAEGGAVELILRVLQIAASRLKNTRLTCTCSKTTFLVVWTKNTFVFRIKARSIIFAFANCSALTLHCIRSFLFTAVW